MFNKNLFALICCICCIELNSLSANNSQKSGGVHWQTNVDSATQEAKAANKPIILYFTWSEGCTYCTKLEEEVFKTPEFVNRVIDQFVFVKLDYSAQDPQLREQHDQFQRKYNVRDYPTLIIIDPRQNTQIGTTGYRPGGGQQYADHLLQFSNNYSGYKQKVSNLNAENLKGYELKQLYTTAKKLNFEEDMIKIVLRGIQSDESLYFSIERFRYLAHQGQIQSKEATILRQQLLAADSHNRRHIPYQIALIEFETYSTEMEKNNGSLKIAIAPLISYIEKFGQQDKQNCWRLQMIISQVYLDKNLLTEALRHAQFSYDSAPNVVQPEIARAIQSIRSQIPTSLSYSI